MLEVGREIPRRKAGSFQISDLRFERYGKNAMRVRRLFWVVGLIVIVRAGRDASGTKACVIWRGGAAREFGMWRRLRS